MVTEADKAWIAGFTDGEGCLRIGVSKRSGHDNVYYARVIIGNTDEDIIRWIYEIYGGTLLTRKPARPGWKGAYVWQSTASSLVVFSGDIFPYLKVKKEQADLLLEFLRSAEEYTRTKVGFKYGRPRVSPEELAYREAVYLKFKELNRKGRTHEPTDQEA